MSLPYDAFTFAFLDKVTEYEFAELGAQTSTEILDGYMKRSISQFSKVCIYDLSHGDDDNREFDIDILEEDLDEIIDIVSEGMLVQWMKPYMYKQENYELVLNTVDFNTYSPAELLKRITSAYKMCQTDFSNRIISYSYRHGDLTDLHL